MKLSTLLFACPLVVAVILVKASVAGAETLPWCPGGEPPDSYGGGGGGVFLPGFPNRSSEPSPKSPPPPPEPECGCADPTKAVDPVTGLPEPEPPQRKEACKPNSFKCTGKEKSVVVKICTGDALNCGNGTKETKVASSCYANSEGGCDENAGYVVHEVNCHACKVWEGRNVPPSTACRGTKTFEDVKTGCDGPISNGDGKPGWGALDNNCGRTGKDADGFPQCNGTCSLWWKVPHPTLPFCVNDKEQKLFCTACLKRDPALISKPGDSSSTGGGSYDGGQDADAIVPSDSPLETPALYKQ